MKKTLVITSALFALVAVRARAQSNGAVRLQLEPGSEISVEGTSTLHAFHCKTDKISAYVDVDPAYTTDLTKVPRPIVSVQVTVVVKTLSCGNRTMDNNMYGTLKADENQVIKYKLSGYDVLDGSASAFAANAKGTLTIAGKERPVDFRINASRLTEGKATAEGEESLLLTDFGIDPPSFMFGRLKVGNEVKVKFSLKAGPTMIAQLAAAMNQQ
jgi:polyisoprenoid-binding protein YceI